jgi:hypothetical protein
MVSKSVCFGIWHPFGAHDHILITVVSLWFSSYGARSLMRGQVWNLLVQSLLGLASAVTLGSKSHRTRDHVLLSHLRLGCLFVTSYDSWGYGGGILSCLHTESSICQSQEYHSHRPFIVEIMSYMVHQPQLVSQSQIRFCG